MLHDYDKIIFSIELKKWLKEYPTCKDHLAKGYREVISDIKKNVFSDSRATTCDHILNLDFLNDPRYFFSFRKHPHQNLICAACIYVFPKYRGHGYGTHMINQLKLMVRDLGAVQVAVEKENADILIDFYLKHHFKTTGTFHTNALGKSYIDLFWSGKKYILHDSENCTLLEPRPYDID